MNVLNAFSVFSCFLNSQCVPLKYGNRMNEDLETAFKGKLDFVGLLLFFSSRNYYGSKIAMYFAWLGFYTQMLVVPSIIGLIIFIYGVAYMDDSYPRYVSCMPVPQLLLSRAQLFKALLA